jgi:hypothetical protein
LDPALLLLRPSNPGSLGFLGAQRMAIQVHKSPLNVILDDRLANEATEQLPVSESAWKIGNYPS